LVIEKYAKNWSFCSNFGQSLSGKRVCLKKVVTLNWPQHHPLKVQNKKVDGNSKFFHIAQHKSAPLNPDFPRTRYARQKAHAK